MDRLEAMAIFVAAVDVGSLAGAARKLGISAASATRAVSRLEARAGERLLERTTRHFAMTDAGSHHHATYRAVLDDLARLDRGPDGGDVTGTVVVSAPELFGRVHVLPVVESFLATHPLVQVRLLLLNRMVDLVGEGIDVAIRLAPLPDSSLKAVRIGELRRVTCAAPSYLFERGSPRVPGELPAHWCIGLNDAGAQDLWRYREGASDRTRSVRVPCRLACNSAAAAIQAAERGMGIVRALSYQIDRQITEGSLIRVLEAYELEAIPVNIVLPPYPRRRDAVRGFVDHAVPMLRRSLMGNGTMPEAERPARAQHSAIRNDSPTELS